MVFDNRLYKQESGVKASLRLLLLITILSTAFVHTLFAQENNQNITFNGSANLSDNFYSSSGIDPRQPGNLFTGIFRANISLFNQVDLPFEFYYSTQQTAFQQPFNQFGISPRLTDWLTLHGGYFSTRISDFTFGDLRVLGGGIELTPGDFRLKAFYGRSRQAVEPNKVSFAPEVYKQNVYGVSLGYGNMSKSFFNLNVFHAKDDSASIKSDSVLVAPNENLVGSIDFGVRLGKALNVRGELGMSAFSSDMGAQEVDDISISSYLFTPNFSTKVDAAAKVNINIKPSKFWSVNLSSRWIGPGYRTLGYALLPNDLVEFNVAPSLRLIKNKLNIRSKVGIRYNNLQDQKLSTTSRFTGFIAANYQVNKTFGIDVNYNKNQIESGHKYDTLRLSNVFNSFSISPRLFFQGFGGTNNLIATYSYQDVSDKNVYTQSISNNHTNSVYLVHSLSYVSSLSFATTALYNSTELPTITSRIYHVSETISRRFFNNKLSASASVGANFIKVTESNKQFVFRVNASYNVGKMGSLSFNISNNTYNGNGVLAQNYNEIYGSIQYNINF
ncbi:MAG: hypothetical protein JEY96_06885 [Bacteroidales bacterium]|nr:hypothetical protein [Bacteroidales bacterium]